MSRLRRKKWLKLCDDFISNKVVHLDKELINTNVGTGPIFIEGYTGKGFGLLSICRLTCRHGHFGEYTIMVKYSGDVWTGIHDDSHPTIFLESKKAPLIEASNLQGLPMFILIRKFIQDVDRVSSASLPSLIRIEGLKTSNQITCPCWEPRQNTLVVPNPVIVTPVTVPNVRRATVFPPKTNVK